MLKIGCHLSIAKGYTHMGEEALSIDANTSWRAEWIEGPVELFDQERGPDRGLLFTPIILQVTVSHR